MLYSYNYIICLILVLHHLQVDFRCQHNIQRNAGNVTKNTSCAATMYIVL